jgi:hypothetical protein
VAITPKTIYLEADEEITSVIDKIRKTEFSDIVLMVPKGASISQSVVNLKLIKRQAETLNKVLSIVTGDKVLRNLAEKVGIAAAAAVGGLSAAETVLAAAPVATNDSSPLVTTDEVIIDKKTAPIVVTKNEPGELTISEADDLEDEEGENFQEEGQEPEAAPKSLMPKFPWLKVLLFAGIPLLALLLAAYIYLPRAKAIVYMKSEGKPVSVNIGGEKTAKLDTEKAVIPTQVIEVLKEGSKKYPASGKKDAGTKATGKLEIYLSSGKTARTWTAGTRIQLGSDSSLIYLTNTSVSLTPSSIAQVNVTAQNPGEKYNASSGKTFSAVNDPEPTITSSAAISGGTTKQVTVVTQGDINSAKDSLSKDTTTEATAEFSSQTNGQKVIDDTKKTEVVSATASPAVDEEATDFTMTVKVSVRAVTLNAKDLVEIVKAEVNRQLGVTRQIIDDGSGKLEFRVDNADLETGKVTGTITTTAYVANKLEQDKVKAELTGLNNTQASNYLMSLDGVESSKLEYFPPFLKSFPRIKNNIILTITVSDSSRN